MADEFALPGIVSSDDLEELKASLGAGWNVGPTGMNQQVQVRGPAVPESVASQTAQFPQQRPAAGAGTMPAPTGRESFGQTAVTPLGQAVNIGPTSRFPTAAEEAQFFPERIAVANQKGKQLADIDQLMSMLTQKMTMAPPSDLAGQLLHTKMQESSIQQMAQLTQLEQMLTSGGATPKVAVGSADTQEFNTLVQQNMAAGQPQAQAVLNAYETMQNKKVGQAGAVTTAQTVGRFDPKQIGGAARVAAAGATATARTAAEQVAGITGTKPGEVWVDKAGNVAQGMNKQLAVSSGYMPVNETVAQDIQTGRQALQILGNMRDVADDLQQKGKFVQAGPALESLWDAVNLQWRGVAKDPDLMRWQAQTTQLITALRNLGDKGVRAMEAFQGATGLVTGQAPYEAVAPFLEQLDNEVRSKAPLQTPNAFDAIRGARHPMIGAAQTGVLTDQHRAALKARGARAGQTIDLGGGKIYTIKAEDLR